MQMHDDDLSRFAADGTAPLPVTNELGYVEHDGARIWYATYGVGSPVILLHGGLGHSGNWGYQVPALVWNLGSVVGLGIAGSPFFLAQPESNGWNSPQELGSTTVRVELFCDNPDAVIARAVAAGANGSFDEIRDHRAPWGAHRQGGFIDPFGRIWLIGDRSPLRAYPAQ